MLKLILMALLVLSPGTILAGSCSVTSFFANWINSEADSKQPWYGLPYDVQGRIRAPLSALRTGHHWHESTYQEWKSSLSENMEFDTSFGRFYFEEVMSKEERNRFLVLFSKLRHEGLWSQVSKIQWVGGTIVMSFHPISGETRFRRLLARKGYGDWWGAGRNARWGVRKRFRGAELHFKAGDRYGDAVHVHIDHHNPGDPRSGETSGALRELPGAISHYWYDEENRDDYTAIGVFLTLCSQGEKFWYVNR